MLGLACGIWGAQLLGGGTLFGLSSLLAGAIFWWLLSCLALGGWGCQEFLLGFWGKVVPLCLQVLLRRAWLVDRQL